MAATVFWGDRRPGVFAPSYFYVLSQMPQRSLQIIVSPRVFFTRIPSNIHELSKFVMLWIYFSESHFSYSKEFSEFQVRCD